MKKRFQQLLRANVQLLRRLRAERDGVLLADEAAALQGHRRLPAQGRQRGQTGDTSGGMRVRGCIQKFGNWQHCSAFTVLPVTFINIWFHTHSNLRQTRDSIIFSMTEYSDN